MQAIIDMAKAHLQNVAVKIQELENQQKIIQGEIDKLKNYLNDGLANVETISSQLQ